MLKTIFGLKAKMCGKQSIENIKKKKTEGDDLKNYCGSGKVYKIILRFELKASSDFKQTKCLNKHFIYFFWLR